MKEDRVFVDTNIWIYGLTESELEADKNKREISLLVLEELLKQQAQIFISIQVVNECHWNLVRKFELPDEKVVKLIHENVIKITNIVSLHLTTYMKANTLRIRYNLSFWDSLIVASALESNCSILYTEDMQDGQVIENRLKIVNPFSGI
ncbi:PilT protein domain protein [Thermodesulfatator indicus DSM 15286]|uniref:PilT protein domain protein n=1 Tax=Thermodesulfatator indicus (strain DSM 15286 / JCM 11887 / CIR29812) TaxID=667014 RepID=F8AC62_THEID|nr:PIN domain-containing protein [Thermodesulfatator indicus]AEH44618.1 PilT protein domain protein [Thermodesulfatator indicus DSM 15286]